MTEIYDSEKCQNCTFFFRRWERLDPGISVPVEACVRDLDPELCQEYQDKWYPGKEQGHTDYQEEAMTIEEYRDFLKLRDATRLRLVREELAKINARKGK